MKHTLLIACTTAFASLGQQEYASPAAFAEHAVGLRRDGKPLPIFKSDEARDKWLRENSVLYRSMAETIDQRGGVRFRRQEIWSGGVSRFDAGQRWIELNDELHGGRRLCVIIFEL